MMGKSKKLKLQSEKKEYMIKISTTLGEHFVKNVLIIHILKHSIQFRLKLKNIYIIILEILKLLISKKQLKIRVIQIN